VITTLSAQSSSESASAIDLYAYAKGIAILTSALVLSGFLGLIQDWTYAAYGRPSLTSSSDGPAPWQESMFYLHFLALPMFIPLLHDLTAQMREMNMTGPRAEFCLPPIPIPRSTNWTSEYPMNLTPPYSLPNLPIHLFRQTANASLISISQVETSSILLSFSIPQIYLPLIVNTITQLFCVAGVHRLTTRVSALTVTLVLVVRKAASLIISVVGVSKVGLILRDATITCLKKLGITIPAPGGSYYPSAIIKAFVTAFAGMSATKTPPPVDDRMMWTGAALVLLGTVGYTIGSSKPAAKDKAKTE